MARNGTCGPGLPGAHGVDLRGVPPSAEARRHYDAHVHAQGDRCVGCAYQGPDGSGLRHYRVVADQYGGRRCSLHIRNKAAANSTVFLVCRPRARRADSGNNVYWEDVEPRVAKAVRERIGEFQEAGIAGVDLYLASFGPALEEFSRRWPLKRGTPREIPQERRRRRQQALFEDEWDPYTATPEDALDAARREVKRWRLEQLTHLKSDADLDPPTAFFALAWDAFRAPVFSYDEALRLARAVGTDLDGDIVGRLAGKKGGDIILWDSAHRAAKGALGPVDGSRGMIDALHHGAHLARLRSLATAREALARLRW